jgi:V8-like Glu-specific endopeptidase
VFSLNDRALSTGLIVGSAFVIGVACSKSSNSQAIGQNAAPVLGEKTAWRGPSAIHEQVIYGSDDRHDLYDESDPGMRQVADATVGVMRHSDMKQQANGTFTLSTQVFSEHYALCADEPFRDQDTAPFCSGFLISPDTVVSAGHCVTNEKDCGEVAFIFGYSLSTPSSTVKSIPASEVYNCAHVMHTQAPSKGADFSILKLDRPVTGHLPLKLRASGSPSAGDDVGVLGYPSGLPLKIAGGAKIRRVLDADGYFVANLDTYGGNSGSAVVNMRTLEVEGVLVRGERDFVLRPEGKCMISNRCLADDCRGEDITLIKEVEKFTSAPLAAWVTK